MAMGARLFNYLYQFLDSMSFLIIAAVGLAIIFGMMGLINLAHGEYVMLGAYITTLTAKAGIYFPIAVLLGTIGVAIWGGLVNQLIISRLYARPLDSVVTSWGISLIMSQGILVLFGPSLQGISTPMGSFTVGGLSYSVYRVFLAFFAVALLLALWVLFKRTKFGLHSRATMQNAEIAHALGVNSNRMYLATYMLGSGLAGLCGGLYAPTMSIVPTFGNGFMVQSFVTVVVGGAEPILGSLMSSAGLGVINSVLSQLYGTLMGKIGMLVVAIVFIRVLPDGFSGLIERHRLKVRKTNER